MYRQKGRDPLAPIQFVIYIAPVCLSDRFEGITFEGFVNYPVTKCCCYLSLPCCRGLQSLLFLAHTFKTIFCEPW